MQLNRPFAAVTPTLDGDVLAVLAGADEIFTISQIHRQVGGASAEGIRKVLIRLCGQGVVLHGQVGRTSTYRLNRGHLAVEPILALSHILGTLLGRIESCLASWAEPPVYAAVFGSAATGRMAANSDIDLFLVRGEAPTDGDDPDHWQQQLCELAEQVSAWTGNDARIVEYTVDDLRAAAASGERLIADVSEQGLTVAGAHGWLSGQLREVATVPRQR